MNFEKPKNPNYAAIVVKLQTFVNLPNCDNVKAALIFGNSVIVGKDTQEGSIGLFFPVECQLSKEFLGNNNQFRKPEFGNVDESKKGFFEAHGRVKAMKFRGHKSEGFWIPLDSIAYTGIKLDEVEIGSEFDKINDHEICQKYIARHNPPGTHTKQGRLSRVEDKIVEGQFRFHIDTENLRRNIHKIEPHMYISISDKWHGTSAVISNILVKRELKWWERGLQKVGVNIQDQEYGLTWSSRRVVKGVAGSVKKNSVHFYSSDVWGTVAREIGELIPKGYTIYGEIVGYTPDGAMIQKGYHYGCQPGDHRFLVYRVTSTNPDGKVIELSWPQMRTFCNKNGLEMVREYYYGPAWNFFGIIVYPEGYEGNAKWQQKLLDHLIKTYVTEEMCSFNNNEVPAEGIVLRVDALDEAPAYKLKNFRFLEAESKALDTGEVDMETQQSEEIAVGT